MKTSFFFVLWILIYPILGLLNNTFIDNNDFIVALAAVWGLSWLLNRLMPKTLRYERASHIAPLLEEVYTGNVIDFKKRVTRDMWIESMTSVYFIAASIVIALAIFTAGVNDWLALAVFIFLSFGAITRSVNLLKAKCLLKANPTPKTCVEIVDETYKLDYASYYDQRQRASYEDMLPPRPHHFKVFQIFSIVIAAIASLLGLCFIITAILITIGSTSFEVGAIAGMNFLYGSLATYFGIKDMITISHNLKVKKSLTIENK